MSQEVKVAESATEDSSRDGAPINITLASEDQPPSEKHIENWSSEYPEGGLRAWAVVAGAFCAQFCGFGYTTAFGVYQDFYTRFYITSESPSTISWIGSVNAFLVIASGIYAGRLYDKGYFYHTVYGGSALIIFSLFMLSLCQPDHVYQNFLAQAIGQGLGAGIMYVPSIAVISHYFHRKRALAMSVAASGSALGALLHPIMLNNLFLKVGFGRTVRASAGLVAGLLVISCLLMRPRLPPPEKTPNLAKTLKKFSRDGAYICCSVGLMLFPIAMYFPVFFLQLDAAEHGLSEKFAFYVLVIMNGGNFVGRISPVILTRVAGVVPMVVAGTGVCAILVLALIGVKTVAGFVVFAVIFGWAQGVFIALMAPLVAILSDDLSELGLRMGVAFTLCGVGALVGPPIDGALLTGKFLWWRPALLSGLFGVLGTGFFVAMMVILHRRGQGDLRK